ncbi:hypothetical protein HOY82DRAFT_610565 [Tuber indicum]|nr:hypothetical protein HOY82DRAFT_610565 [Tuber indicum]
MQQLRNYNLTSRASYSHLSNHKGYVKFCRIKGPHGDGIRTITKDKTITFRKAKKQLAKDAKKAARLQRK